MNREDIIRMAREAYGDWYPNAVPHELERFAALVAAAEREACAAIAEKELDNNWMLASFPPKSSAAWNIRAAIRARGEALNNQ